MRWPWQRHERRDSGGDFSDAVVRLIEAQAAGTAADASSTAAVEAASGALSRAFASAEVVGWAAWVAEAVSPGVLAQVGRDLIRNGDSMHVNQDGSGRTGAADTCIILALGRFARPGLLDRARDGLWAFDEHDLELARSGSDRESGRVQLGQRAAIYARVSTADQSCEWQIAELTAVDT